MSDGIMDGQRAYERVQKKRIAAAALELLEALEWYEAKMSLVNRHDSEGDAARDALARDYGQKARAAIAKARGEMMNTGGVKTPSVIQIDQLILHNDEDMLRAI